MQKLTIIFVLFTAAGASSGDAFASMRGHRPCRPVSLPNFAPSSASQEGRPVSSPVTVLNLHDSGPGSLRAALQFANENPGTTIQFARGLHGTIKLTTGELTINESTVIRGPGAHWLTVSGGNHSRVFAINSGATVTISGLTISYGRADHAATLFPGLGGGILNQGTLTLKRVVVSHNQAAGAAGVKTVFGVIPGGLSLTGVGGGGGVANFNTMTVSNCAFLENRSQGASGGSTTVKNTYPGVAFGGGLANVGTATTTVKNCRFIGNVAQAGNDWNCAGPSDIAGNAGGGAVASFGYKAATGPAVARLQVSGSHFANNRAIGGSENESPVLPGHAFGGAIASHKFKGGAELSVIACSFERNHAIGGNHSVITVQSDRNNPNSAVGGGVFVCGTGKISGSRFSNNRALGGEGAASSKGFEIMKNGGSATGAGIEVAFEMTEVSVSYCRIKCNRAVGGHAGVGGSGGTASGGGIATAAKAKMHITGSIIVHNESCGGKADASGPPSNGGEGRGGGVSNSLDSTTTLRCSSIAHNCARGGKGTHGGSDGKGIDDDRYNLVRTLSIR